MKCGNSFDEDDISGNKQSSIASNESKNPILAMILSLVIVGVGQIYNGQTTKGILMCIGGIIGGALSATLLWWVIALWSAVDAYNYASTI